VFPRITFNPQDFNKSTAGVISPKEIFRAVETMATVSPFCKKAGIIIFKCKEINLQMKSSDME
jgi:hypothetical protein